MKIFELLNLLSPEEKKSVKRDFHVSNTHQRELFSILYAMDEDTFLSKRQIVYKKVYGKPWKQNSERHLKNQLTDLFQMLRAHLAQKWIDKENDSFEFNKYSNYLNNIMSRLELDFFEKEWNYYAQLFETKQFYFGLSKLYNLKFNKTIKNPKNYKEAIGYLKKSYTYDLMAYSEETALLRYTALNLNYFKEMYGIEKLLTEADFENLRIQTEKEFFNPLHFSNSLIVTEDEKEKWTYVLEIMKVLQKEDVKLKANVRFKLCQSIFNYGIILIHEENLEKAKAIFDFIYEKEIIENTVSNPSVFYFNYSTLLLKLGYMKEALKFHRIVMDGMENVPISRKTHFIIRDIYLNILNEDYENVFSDISKIQPSLFKEDQMLYVRALLIMYLIDTNDMESAQRECENARRSVHFRVDLAKEESAYINFICKLLAIQSKEKISSAKFKQVKDSLFDSQLWKSSSHLFRIWLGQYIERLDKRIL